MRVVVPVTVVVPVRVVVPVGVVVPVVVVVLVRIVLVRIRRTMSRCVRRLREPKQTANGKL